MATKLLALGLRNYRGIGPEWQMMPRFEKFNFFIGANNAGKSAVLNFLSSQLSEGVNKVSSEKVTPLERFDGGSKGLVGYAFGVAASAAVENALSKMSDEHQKRASRPLVTKIVEKLSTNGVLWLAGEVGGQPGFHPMTNPTVEVFDGLGSQDDWYRL